MPSTPEPRPHRTRNVGEESVDLGWDELKEALTSRWPRLNEHDLAAMEAEFGSFVAGNYQLLIGRLRERYGLDESSAEQEVQVLVRTLDPTLSGTPLRQHSTATQGHGRTLGAR